MPLGLKPSEKVNSYGNSVFTLNEKCLGFYAWTLTTTVVSDYTQTPRLLANNAMYVRRQLKVTDNLRD